VLFFPHKGFGAFFLAATHFKRARLTFSSIVEAVFTRAIFHRIAFEAVYYSGIAFQGRVTPFLKNGNKKWRPFLNAGNLKRHL